MLQAFGLTPCFDHTIHDWFNFKSRLLLWFTSLNLNDGSDALKLRRKKILLTALKKSTYELARCLALPKVLEELEFSEIMLLLDKHFFNNPLLPPGPGVPGTSVTASAALHQPRVSSETQHVADTVEPAPGPSTSGSASAGERVIWRRRARPHSATPKPKRKK